MVKIAISELRADDSKLVTSESSVDTMENLSADDLRVMKGGNFGFGGFPFGGFGGGFGFPGGFGGFGFPGFGFFGRGKFKF